MKIKKLYKDGRVFRGLEVVMDELEFINKLYNCTPSPFLFKKEGSNTPVAVMFGDIETLVKLDKPIKDCFIMDIDYVRETFMDIETSTFDFEDALKLVKKGFKVTRANNMHPCKYLTQIDGEIKQVIDGRVLDWSPSQEEIYADDWMVITGESKEFTHDIDTIFKEIFGDISPKDKEESIGDKVPKGDLDIFVDIPVVGEIVLQGEQDIGGVIEAIINTGRRLNNRQNKRGGRK